MSRATQRPAPRIAPVSADCAANFGISRAGNGISVLRSSAIAAVALDCQTQIFAPVICSLSTTLSPFAISAKSAYVTRQFGAFNEMAASAPENASDIQGGALDFPREDDGTDGNGADMIHPSKQDEAQSANKANPELFGFL